MTNPLIASFVSVLQNGGSGRGSNGGSGAGTMGGSDGRGFGDGGHGFGGRGFDGGGIGLAILAGIAILIIGFGIWWLLQRRKTNAALPSTPAGSTSAPLAGSAPLVGPDPRARVILDERFARGEIDSATYLHQIETFRLAYLPPAPVMSSPVVSSPVMDGPVMGAAVMDGPEMDKPVIPEGDAFGDARVEPSEAVTEVVEVVTETEEEA
jgi:hypothetical protein